MSVPERLTERTRSASNSARAIYGTIVAAAVVAGYSEDSAATGRDLALAVAGTVVVFWLAHVYSDVLARRLETRGVRMRDHLHRSLSGEAPLLLAGSWIIAPLILAWVGVVSVDNGVELAMGVGIAALFFWGWRLARRDGSRWYAALLAGALSACFGVVIVALKTLVH